MELLSLVVPVVAVGSLTAALVVPFRDARRGDRATLHAGNPLVALHGTMPVLEETPEAGTGDAGVESDRISDERKPTAYAALRRILDIDARLSRAFGAARTARQRPASTREDATSACVGEDTRPFTEHVAALVRDDGDATLGTPASGESPPDVPREVNEPAPEHDLEPDGDLATTATVRIDVPPPLTRMRLRPERGAQWPTLLPIPHVGLTRDARHALLCGLTRGCDATCEPALAAAFAEEDAAGRMLVLEAIARLEGPRAKAVLFDALRGGSDEERARAIDLFVRRGDRDSLEAALDDRVDAIAARAALAYVGTNERAAFERVLAPRLDGTRRAAVLALLAGILV